MQEQGTMPCMYGKIKALWMWFVFRRQFIVYNYIETVSRVIVKNYVILHITFVLDCDCLGFQYFSYDDTYF